MIKNNSRPYFLYILAFVLIASSCKKKGGEVAPSTEDFIKIKADGTVLNDQSLNYDPSGSEDDGTKWSCARVNDQNKTFTLWEIKSEDESNERYKENVYSWHDPSAAVSGSANGPAQCSKSVCTTKQYIDFVNNLNSGQGLCGKNNWRLPTADELGTIARVGFSPTIDLSFFPNTIVGGYWTSETTEKFPDSANVALFSQNFKIARSVKSTGQNQIRLISK